MTTSTVTIHQIGTHDTAGSGWAPPIGAIVSIGGTLQPWYQLDKTLPLVNLITGFTVQMGSLAEAGTLTVYTLMGPVVDNFSAANLPAPSVVSSTFALTSPGAVTIALHDANGQATPLGAQMRARFRGHSAGGHRFAIGFSWNGVGGLATFTTFSLTYTPEFTGANHLRAPAGTDRAVECPRCGVALLESQLVKDEVTGHMVGPECFDSKNIRPFNWPFRG